MKMTMLSASLGLLLAHVPAGAASVDADAISPLAASALSDSQLDTLRGGVMVGGMSFLLLNAQFGVRGLAELNVSAPLPAFEIKDFSFDITNPTTIGSATGGAGAGKALFDIVKLVILPCNPCVGRGAPSS